MADRLEQEILSRAPEVGTKLTSERQLAERFGVSRPIVRESLRSLAERGLIEIRPGRGAYIRATRPTDAAHPLDALLRRQQITGRRLVEARLMLEQEAAYRAAERAEAEDLELMEKAMERFEAARDLVERAHWDLSIHAVVARMSHNPVIETMFAAISGPTFELLLRSLAESPRRRAAVPQHSEIFDAIRSHDALAAKQLMEAHISSAFDWLGADTDEPLDLVAKRQLEAYQGPSASLEEILETLGAPGGAGLF